MDGHSPIAEAGVKRFKKDKVEVCTDEQTTKSEQFVDKRRWEDLPVNCLVAVFEKLALDDMILGVPFVCKSWHHASLDPLCWKTLDFTSINPWPSSPFSERFMHDYRLEKYSLRGFLKFIIARGHNLATKLMVPEGRLPLSDLIYLCQECPMLNIFFPRWISDQDPTLLRRFMLKLNESILRNARNAAVN